MMVRKLWGHSLQFHDIPEEHVRCFALLLVELQITAPKDRATFIVNQMCS